MNYSDLLAFRHLSPTQIEDFVNSCHQGHIAANRSLLKQGYRSNRLFFVIEGRVRVFLTTPEGDRDLSEIVAPTVLGEISFFSGEANSANVATVTPARVLVMSFSTLQSRLQAGDGAAAIVVFNLAEAIAKRAVSMTQKLNDLYSCDSEIQLAQVKRFQKQLFGEWSFI